MCNTVNLTVLYEWYAVVLVPGVGIRSFNGKFICSLYEDLDSDRVKEEVSRELLKQGLTDCCVLSVRYTASPAGGYI